MSEDELKKIKKAHFVGIGGIGISAIAKFFLARGIEVSGSDRSASVITEELKRAGAKVKIGHNKGNLPADADLVVYSIAIPDDNGELLKARKLDIPTYTYPEMLGKLSKEKYTIAVSGTHGKTTTTAMLAEIFVDAKKSPTVIVGSLLNGVSAKAGEKSNLIIGDGKYLITEACEYRRSFLNLSPKILVITNIDKDHLDYYKDIKDIQNAFASLVKKLGEDGILVCDPEGKYMKPVIRAAKCRVVDYREEEVDGELNVPGAHNVLNAQAALAVAKVLRLPMKKAQKSVRSFRGTWRRFEYKGKTKKGVEIYDDYGHHPTEVRATLRAAKERFPESRINVIFQPHLYSRTQKLLNDFKESFNSADRVILLPVYAAREKMEKGFKSDALAKAISEKHQNTFFAKDFSTASQVVRDEMGDSDLLITMGAGDVYKISESLIAK